MGVHSGAVEAGGAQVQHIVADAAAHFLHQLHIPGGGHDVFVRVGAVAGGDAGQSLGKALGTVIVQSGRLGDRHRQSGIVVTLADHLGHLLQGELVQQGVPIGVIIILADHHGEGHAVVRAGGGHLGGGALHTVIGLVEIQRGQDLLVCLQIGDGLRPGTLPVAAGEIGHVGSVVGEVRIIKLVGNGVSGNRRDGIGAVIQQGLIVAVGHFNRAVGGHAVGSGVTLGGENVVDSVMGIGSGGEVIVAGIQNVGLGAQTVICGQLFPRHCNGDGLSGAGLQNTGLGKAAQFHSGLFDLEFPVIVGVGRLEVDLHHVLAGGIAGVGYRQGDRKGIGGRIIAGVEIRPGELGIAQAVAKGIGYLGCVIVVAGVALSHDDILVAGLAIAIAHIDALLIEGVILVAVQEVDVIPGGSIGGVGVGIGGAVEAHHSGGGGVVIAVGVHQASGGIDLAGENIGYGVESPGAGVADPQGRIDVVLLQEGAGHGVGGVDEHDDSLKIFLHHGQHILLFLSQGEDIGAIHELLRGQIEQLAAQTGDDDNGGVVILRVGGSDISGVGGYRHFVDMVIGPVIVLQTVHTLDRGADVRGAVTSGIEIPQDGVDGKTFRLQSFFESGSVAGIDIGRAGAASSDVHTGVAEQADGGAAAERQGIVVIFQKYNAFAGELFGHLFIVGFQLFHRREVAFKIDSVLIFVFHFIGVDVKGDIDRLSSAKGNIAGDDSGNKQNSAYSGQNRPAQCSVLARMSRLFHKIRAPFKSMSDAWDNERLNRSSPFPNP